MHELSICGSIADIVTRRAAGRSVKVINVRVGQLRQIVPDTLVYCWELVSADTSLAGSRISVESVPGRGTSFVVEFPLEDLQGARGEAPAIAELGG